MHRCQRRVEALQAAAGDAFSAAVQRCSPKPFSKFLTEPNWTLIGQEKKIFFSSADPVQITWLGRVCGVVAKKRQCALVGRFSPSIGVYSKIYCRIGSEHSREAKPGVALLSLHLQPGDQGQTIEAGLDKALSEEEDSIFEALPATMQRRPASLTPSAAETRR
ncbi:hypothetical protein TGAM01_v208773 [Trichoderma gamsii]|uniref:Uncharacterized protein n=1 Tax=Trichoderma gamsii TaxID=398673 RepID=A0A2P4ZDC1_9HYPO|nr:hypothetical protein TGAM01_v208773 [Trichoderma gamsii]PON22290.1 hypothetical protein TGAM01_v208773 [Trichoderma gamsii]